MASQKSTVECFSCGNTDYYLVEGFYYCTLCQSQSQNITEIDHSDAPAELGAVAANLQIKEKKTRKDKETEEEIPLQPLALVQAYVAIFDHLAAILIRLGLPYTVKEALFRLYALYLRRRGVAFGGTEDSNDVSKPTPFRSKALRIRKRQSAKRIRTEIKLELDEYQSAILEEDDGDQNTYLEFLGDEESAASKEKAVKRKRRLSETTVDICSNDEDNPTIDNSSIDEEDNPKIPDNSEDIAHATRLQPNLIVPFLYLACLAVSPQQICLSDLIRWMKENILPIVEAFEILPERLKHPLIRVHFQNVLWTGRPPTVTSALYRRAIWMANFVGYTPNISFDVDILLARFAYDLNLSKHILARARLILRSVQFVNSSFKFSPLEFEARRTGRHAVPVTPPEVAAVALLIVALKLTFGLDDHCEHVLSRLADQSTVTSGSSSFSFSRWQLQYRMRSAVVDGDSIERVLSRFWIDQRETWLHGVMTELDDRFNDRFESDPRSEYVTRTNSRAYDLWEKGEEKSVVDDGEVDVDSLRNLFNNFTPFESSTGLPPIQNRRLLHPLRETIEQLSKVDQESSMDLNNVDIFKHDFFNDSLDFLNDQSVEKAMEEMLCGISGVGKVELTPFEKIFPCARISTRSIEVIRDRANILKRNLVANMVENEGEYELSTNLTWILKACKSRLQEDTWVLYRAVQNIELGMDVYLKNPKPSVRNAFTRKLF